LGVAQQLLSQGAQNGGALMKRFIAIGCIWLGCTIAWMILGSTIMVRSGQSSSELVSEVWGLWGPPMEQAPPRALYVETRQKIDHVTTTDATGRPTTTEVTRDEDVEVDIPLERSDIDVHLGLAQRQKGLLWFATYGVDFRAAYSFVNDSPVERVIIMRFPLAAQQAVYDGFEVRDSDGNLVHATIARGIAEWKAIFHAGEPRRYNVAYRSRGTERWGYQLTAGTGQVRAFRLTADTDFPEVDFPPGTLSPSQHGRVQSGWHGEWRFTSLVASQPIGIAMPQKLNPGPLASKITFFAPVGLLFFFFVVAVLAAAQRRRIHPLNYFLFSCAFFAFHLLFAYLVDQLAIFPSFAIASAVSLALVISYARLFVGWRFALREMATAQLLYLVLFSFTFFWTGFTGLAITIGAILTLAVMMQVTGRVRWDEAV
jgi:hypothetical protein